MLLPQVTQPGGAVRLPTHGPVRAEAGLPSRCDMGPGLTPALRWPELTTPAFFPMRKNVKFATLLLLVSEVREKGDALPTILTHVLCCFPVLETGGLVIQVTGIGKVHGSEHDFRSSEPGAKAGSPRWGGLLARS